jgi:hypothetical protein
MPLRLRSTLRKDHRSRRPGRALRALGWIATLTLCACGGEPDGAPKPAVEQAATTSAPPPAATVREVVAPPARPALASNADAPTTAPATLKAPETPAAPEYLLVVFKKKVVHRDADELAPVHGAGYEPLRAFVYLRGKP